MGRAKPVVLDTRSFPTQTAAKAFFKEMLNRYRRGERVSDLDSADLKALLKRHTEYKEKMANGLAYFVVDISPEYGTNCFHIVSPNNDTIHFSYSHCVDQIPR